ncbi:NAD(P)H-binding protein [Streptomyces sp. WMMC500]|uniref:NAD(P)H-binding protein n=1 Tax=Streptomyces sp. WMMC500 TaxID=3015154 RepID=UPI00248B1FCC|nr:NAD(P)H-binding protein [Streptomyces sp. WMMC500]WBB58022.1 NAD(P)H-binding protein [Streptomyces sp. WMMC500]
MTHHSASTEPHVHLVVGGTGKTGRRVAEQLTARGLAVRAVSRRGDVPFDWHDRTTWEPALRGVRAAYLTYAPDLADPAAAPAVRAFTETAVRAGVERLVLLSGRGEPECHPSEDAVRESGAQWTIVRCAWFMQNFDEDFLLDPVLAGELVLPAADVPEPFVDTRDIADVVVAALTEDGHSGTTYELSGPRLLTFGEAAAEIGKATGRDVRYVPVSPEQFREVAAGHLPPDLVELFADLFTRILDGRNAHLSDGVRQALGRAPRDFTDFVREAAERGAWNV